jgi:hypothetical protein
MQQAEQKVKKCFPKKRQLLVSVRIMCVRLRCACTESCGSMCTNKKQMAQACHLPYVFSL